MIIQTKITEIVKKYKYIAIILAVGIVLLLLPTPQKATDEKQVISQDEGNILSVEDQLCQILGSVKGAGKVQVMLSIANGEEIMYQVNESNSSDTDRNANDKDTVLITNSGRNQTGLIRQINPPMYSGALIVCQGADEPSVRLAIVEAVSKITGLRTDKISVLKMK